MTLLDLLQQDGFSSRKVSNTYGGEYTSPCPECGGEDRFRTWPNHKGGRYWCRGCGKTGDNIQYLRDFRQMTYPEACQFLGETPKIRLSSALHRREVKPAFIPREATTPLALWQGQAGTFLAMTQKTLWSVTGQCTRDFLHGKGLSDTTIQAAGLGCNPKDIFLDRGTWGLPQEMNAKGKPKKLWLPAGLVIPCSADRDIIRLRTRRPEGEPRYVVTPGSDTRPMTWGLDKNIIVVVESELDGLLLNQEAGDIAGVIALGSATARPDSIVHTALEKADLILLALDTDEPGAKASSLFWRQTYGSKMKRWPCIVGKDPSEAWQKGLDIRAWITVGIGTVDTMPAIPGIPVQVAANTGQGTAGNVCSLVCKTCGGTEFYMTVARSGWICEKCHPPDAERFVAVRNYAKNECVNC